MNEIQLQYVATEKVNEDMWRASGMPKTCRKIIFLSVIVFVLYLILLALLHMMGESIDWSSEITSGAVIGALLLIVLWRFNSLPKRTFAKNPLSNTTVEWKITESAMELVTSTYRINFEWRAFTNAKETPAGFLLYVQQGLGYWMSKPAFHSEAEVDLVRSWILQHNIKLER